MEYLLILLVTLLIFPLVLKFPLYQEVLQEILKTFRLDL